MKSFLYFIIIGLLSTKEGLICCNETNNEENSLDNIISNEIATTLNNIKELYEEEKLLKEIYKMISDITISQKTKMDFFEKNIKDLFTKEKILNENKNQIIDLENGS